MSEESGKEETGRDVERCDFRWNEREVKEENANKEKQIPVRIRENAMTDRTRWSSLLQHIIGINMKGREHCAVFSGVDPSTCYGGVFRDTLLYVCVQMSPVALALAQAIS